VLALLLFVCLGVPRLLLWSDPLGDNLVRFHEDVMGGDLFFDEYEGTLWRDAAGQPLPAGTMLQLSGVLEPAPVMLQEVALDDPFTLSLWQGRSPPGLVRVQRVAYLADPALPRDRWGRRWLLSFVRVEFATGDWGWEGGGEFFSTGENGRFEWGDGDDHHVWGSWSGSTPPRHWFPIFLVFGVPLAVVHAAGRALRQAPGRDPVREGLVAVFVAAPVWGLLLLLKLGFPMLDQAPLLAPLADLLWVRPSSALVLTGGGVAWGAALWWRLGRPVQEA
jgi:hypothetical protein